jgi:hypothetical protein
MGIGEMLAIGREVVNTFSLVNGPPGGRDRNRTVALDRFVTLEVTVEGPGGERLVMESVLCRGNRVSVL